MAKTWLMSVAPLLATRHPTTLGIGSPRWAQPGWRSDIGVCVTQTPRLAQELFPSLPRWRSCGASSHPAGKIGKIERELMARHRPKLADRSAPGSGHGDAGRNRS
jgi:hypothetical protein